MRARRAPRRTDASATQTARRDPAARRRRAAAILPPRADRPDEETPMTDPLFRTAIAGSLPKPGWLAETATAR